jgi:tRNA(His) 5'-end guanylyltransferase
MAGDSTSLGDRMKRYEAVTRSFLPRRTYTVVRVDGRAFHSYLRGSPRPYAYSFMDGMDAMAADMCKEMSGSVLAYVQSDEVSVVMTDFGSINTEPWFGGGVQKICSIAAATATARFAFHWGAEKLATFDARVFTIPDPVEVANYLIWRQRDAVRNSIQMAGQAKFSPSQLHGKSTGAIQEMLWSEHQINWNDYPDGAKRGRLAVREVGEKSVAFTDRRTKEVVTIQADRSWWAVRPAPTFTVDGLLGSLIPLPGF